MELERSTHKFDELRALVLPLGEYAITGSGPLGVRNIREISDVDVIVTNKLWKELENEYGKPESGNSLRIGRFLEFLPQSIFADQAANVPSVKEQLDQSEILNGLPFVRLEHLIFFKRRLRRPKDIADLLLLEEYLRACGE